MRNTGLWAAWSLNPALESGATRTQLWKAGPPEKPGYLLSLTAGISVTFTLIPPASLASIRPTLALSSVS